MCHDTKKHSSISLNLFLSVSLFLAAMLFGFSHKVVVYHSNCQVKSELYSASCRDVGCDQGVAEDDFGILFFVG